MNERNNEFYEEPDAVFEPIPYSRRFKRRMNRLFREEVGSRRIPHPEVDNLWERMRSRMVLFWRKKRNE